MTDKEKVLQVWPDIIVYGNKILWKWLWYRESDPDKISGQFDTEEAAWQNAAESLPDQPEQEKFSHSLHGFDIEGIGKASCDICDALAHWSSTKRSFRCDTHAYPKPVAPLEAKEVPRPKLQGGDYRPHYRKDEVDAYIEWLEYGRDVWRDKCRFLTKNKAADHIVDANKKVEEKAEGDGGRERGSGGFRISQSQTGRRTRRGVCEG